MAWGAPCLVRVRAECGLVRFERTSALRGSRFVRVRECAGALRPLVRVLRVVHVVLRWLASCGKVK